jgi:TrmH family RNA methyltransferase
MITSASNARLKEVSGLIQKAKERREKDAYIIEGIKMFEEAPASEIQEVYVSESYLAKHGISEKLRRTGYETVADGVFDRISDTKTPQGILAVMRQRHYRLEDLLGEKPLLLLLEDIQDPGNLGTMIRAGEGAGMTGIIMSRETVDFYSPKNIRSTMGSIFRVPFLITEDLCESIQMLQKRNIRVFAAHLKGEKTYDASDFTQGTAFLIGNEGNGLKDATANQADSYMKIPMLGKVESLNAGVAASVLLYEAARQRRNRL